MFKLTKIKIIIFAAFLLVNAFLIGAYIMNSKSSRAIRAEVLAEVGEILASKNITVTADIFPIIPAHLPLYMSKNELSNKENIAAHLLGTDNFMVEPNRFVNGDKAMTINGGHFSFYTCKLDEADIKLLGKPLDFWAKMKAKKAIKAANLWTSQTKFTSSKADSASKQIIVKLADYLDSYPVVDSSLVVWAGTTETKDKLTKTEITRIDGYNWLNTTYKKIPNSETKLKTLTEVLIDFADVHDANEHLIITGIEFGYIVGERVPEKVEREVDIGIKISYPDGAFCLSAIY